MLAEIGVRLRGYRLQQNMTIEDLAERAGLNRLTVGNAERGKDARLSTITRVLRVLGRLDSLEAFLPPPAVSPMQLLENRGRVRKRAHGKG